MQTRKPAALAGVAGGWAGSGQLCEPAVIVAFSSESNLHLFPFALWRSPPLGLFPSVDFRHLSGAVALSPSSAVKHFHRSEEMRHAREPGHLLLPALGGHARALCSDRPAASRGVTRMESCGEELTRPASLTSHRVPAVRPRQRVSACHTFPWPSESQPRTG